MSEEFAGVTVDDSDIEVVDEGDDGLVFVRAADADFVEGAFVADGDLAGGVDSVAAYPGLVIGGVVGSGFGESVVCDGWGCSVEGSMWSVVVVGVDELVDVGLELGPAVGSGLGS